MAPKRSKSKSPNTPDEVWQLAEELGIPPIVHIKPIEEDELRRWRVEGLANDVLVLGRCHLEILRFLLHPLVLQFVTTHKAHLMQLTPNSIKCVVAFIILYEVEGKGITLADLFFAFNINKTPTQPSTPPNEYCTNFLTASNPSSQKYFIFLGKQVVDKDWETARGLLVITGNWIPPQFD